jgi:large conductance mechanosensitive channel
VIKEFRDFINRGNVVDLAVAVVIGAAFGAVVTSFTDDVLMQVVAAIVGEPDFSSLTISLGDTEVFYGSFLTAVINFLIIAFAVFLVVKGINSVQARFAAESQEDEEGPSEVELLTQIRDSLRNS